MFIRKHSRGFLNMWDVAQQVLPFALRRGIYPHWFKDFWNAKMFWCCK